MSDAAIFTLVFGGLLVLRIVAATLVFMLILPRGNKCPMCDAVTVRVQSLIARRSVIRLSKRWCLACGWEGYMRSMTTGDMSDAERAEALPRRNTSRQPSRTR